MQRDQFALRRRIRNLRKKPSEAEQSAIAQQLANSIALREKRVAAIPVPNFDEDLPIYQRRAEIAEAIREHQIVVISGETGSGKSTQLPLIALEMGFGIAGMIGHTQPRRIAARGVASRIASQLSCKLGEQVGFKIRFADQTADQTYIKLMTDGILLAETQSDRFLDQYEMIIVDEAHERSLNIDFLLGYLKRILPKKKNLRLVITSATIDTQKFAEHFTQDSARPVPVINVEGRTYPVEIEYRDPSDDTNADSHNTDRDFERHVIDACRDLADAGDGDILVFLPTENDIRALNKKLRGIAFRGPPTDILPLYARLSTEQQNKIFQSHSGRRIVLATNVAESSITVPGIKYVVDSGTARISRYAPKSKVQRLPIEPVSQASANQRAGRCGRIGPGTCIRLYSEEDYESRAKFTTPEIRRTNLASVILQTLSLKLGEISEFPFIDPPGADAIRDGYRTLFEIGAVDERRSLTPLGRKLARLPVDPRIGRMIVQADSENCLSEILIICSGLELQDPRIRPPEKKNAADAQHQKFVHEKSDFLSMLKLWDFFHDLKEELSRSKLRLACAQNYISLSLMRQWQDIHRQLKAMVSSLGLKTSRRCDDYDAIHRSLLSGLLSGVAMLGDRHEYTGPGGIKFHLWPGSGVFASKPKWIIAGEILETSRRYGRTVAKISPDWIEPLAKHLLRYHYSDPYWSIKQQTVMAHERVTLFGLPIIANRRTGYGKIDPEHARDLFIEQALTEGAYTDHQNFYRHNSDMLEAIKSEAAKTRNRELIVDSYLINGFYDQRLPPDVLDAASLRRALKKDRKLDQRLCMERNDLLQSTEETNESQFPDQVQIGAMQIPVDYRFSPGAKDDGATIEIPIEGLGQIDDIQTGWLIPGLMVDRIIALIRSLPKPIRRNLVPAPETAREVAKTIEFGKGSFLESVANGLSRLAGQPIRVEQFKPEKIDGHLKVNIRVVDAEGQILAEARRVGELREQLGPAHASSVVQIDDSDWNQDGLKDWTWDEFPVEIQIQRGATTVSAYPAIVDQQDSVGLRVVDSAAARDKQTRKGLVRLLKILNRKSVRSQVAWLPDLDEHALKLQRIIPSKSLRDQLGDLITRIAFIEMEKHFPASRADFDSLQSNAIERIGVATQDVAKWLPKFSNAVHAALLKVEEMPGRFSSAKGDIRQHIKRLAAEDFLAQIPWRWLQHFPRYFQAVVSRIEKLPTTATTKDREASTELNAYWQRYEQASEHHAVQAIVDPELERFRWMIEEYRVSLFAQNLGTSMTISAKRLDKQWKKVRQV